MILLKNYKLRDILAVTRGLHRNSIFTMSEEIRKISIVNQILTKRRVTTDIFGKCFKLMNVNHYPDILKRRMNKKICGYSLCDRILRKLVDIRCVAQLRIRIGVVAETLATKQVLISKI